MINFIRTRATLFYLAFLALVPVACVACFPKGLNPAQARAMAKHECYAAALEPVLGELTTPILQAILSGGKPEQILSAHGLTPEEISDAARRWMACDGAAAPPRPLTPEGLVNG